MKQLVEYPLDGGGTIFVEVDVPESEAGLVRAARPGEVASRATQTFQEAIEGVKPTAEIVSTSLLAKLRSIPNPPAEVSIMFGLSVSAAAGVVLASAGAQATFEITLIWREIS
jgi:hypothetical protein